MSKSKIHQLKRSSSDCLPAHHLDKTLRNCEPDGEGHVDLEATAYECAECGRLVDVIQIRFESGPYLESERFSDTRIRGGMNMISDAVRDFFETLSDQSKYARLEAATGRPYSDGTGFGE